MKAGSHHLLSQQQDSAIQPQATIELQDFFDHIIPEPIATNIEQNMALDEEFSQLLASSISLSIDEYHEKLTSHTINNSSNIALKASTLVGRSVLIEDGHFYIEQGQSINGRLNIPEDAQHIFVYVENEHGDIVRIIPLQDTMHNTISFAWNGKTRTGDVAPTGEYKFIVSCISNGRVQELKAMTYNKIIRTTIDALNDDVRLYFENDQTMRLNDIVELLKE